MHAVVKMISDSEIGHSASSLYICYFNRKVLGGRKFFDISVFITKIDSLSLPRKLQLVKQTVSLAGEVDK